MKKRKKLIKRIGAVLCALVVVASSLGVSVPYYGATLRGEDACSFAHGYIVDALKKATIEMPSDVYIPSSQNGYEYCAIFRGYQGSTRLYFLVYSSVPLVAQNTVSKESYGYEWNCWLRPNYATQEVYSCSVLSSNSVWTTCSKNLSFFGYNGTLFTNVFPNTLSESNVGYNLVYANHSILCGNTGLPLTYPTEVYESSLGYLQNVKHKVVFDDVPLGENVAETFTERWYYDSLSTTGVDLTSGDYVIRYYQEKWIVTGYGEDDVVKKSGRYVLGDYIVQNGYIETYSESVESTLARQGYEEPSIFDLLWNKFVTTHYYFQIVNAKTNEVGGLLHVYLTDDNGKFGVEHICETLDNEGNYDEGGYKDFIDEDKVTTDDVEQGFDDLENGSNVDFGTVDGVDEFGVTLESFASQVSNVTGGVHALLSSMPPWVLGLLGVSFVLLVVGIIFKIV